MKGDIWRIHGMNMPRHQHFGTGLVVDSEVDKAEQTWPISGLGLRCALAQ